ITADLQESDGALPLIQLNPSWEEMFTKYQIEGSAGSVDVALPPAEFNRLAEAVAGKIGDAGRAGRYPAVVTSTRRRRFLQTVLSAKGIRNPVLSFDEIGTERKPAMLGVA
ncbi:MAG: FHIPEP family type III secretion protein, partial [Pseudomonadota bacterium]